MNEEVSDTSKFVIPCSIFIILQLSHHIRNYMWFAQCVIV